MFFYLMLFFGIVALFKGKFKLSRTKEVTGTPVYIVGFLILGTLFFFPMLYGVLEMNCKDEQEFAKLKKSLVIVDLLTRLGVLIACLVISLAYARPIQKAQETPQSDDDQEADRDDRSDESESGMRGRLSEEAEDRPERSSNESSPTKRKRDALDERSEDTR